MRKVIEYSILIVFLIPLFFINIKSSHDWGDDFAQYIHQAKNIANGLSQNNTGYIFNSDVFIGPQAYPTSFPLLLAPFVKHFGCNFIVFNYIMSFYLMMSCVLGFLILRKYFSLYTSIFTTLIIAYNPILLNFKTEVLSDLPFTSFLLLGILLTLKEKKSVFISVILGLIMAMLVNIRSIGIVFILVYVINELSIKNSLKHASFKFHKKLLITCFCFFVLHITLKVVFPCNTDYPVFADLDGVFERVNEHFSYNLLALFNFFNIYEPKNQYFVGIIAASSLVVFSILGFLYEFKKHKFNFINTFMLVYIACIAFFKFGDAGLRFVSPVLFFVFMYCIIGLKNSIRALVVNWKTVSLSFGVIMLLSYKPAIDKILENEHQVIDGPCTDASFVTFEKIKAISNISNDVIVFEKPRALALFTGCNALAIKNDLSDSETLEQFKKYKIKYVLIHKNLSNVSISNFVEHHPECCKLIYFNEEYQFYKINL